MATGASSNEPVSCVLRREEGTLGGREGTSGQPVIRKVWLRRPRDLQLVRFGLVEVKCTLLDL
jgi:hypothetical protein